MLRLSKLTDYGLVVLAHVARGPDGGLHTARSLAAAAHLPQPTVSKLVKALTRAGLLVGHRGVRGGYSLARPAAAITVAEVIDALDGPIALTACTKHGGHCELQAECIARNSWQKLNTIVTQALGATTLADIGRPGLSQAPTAAGAKL